MLHEHGKIISGLRFHRPTFHAEIVSDCQHLYDAGIQDNV